MRPIIPVRDCCLIRANEHLLTAISWLFFGALAAVPYATNPAPAQLTMPDLSQDQGGWGSGASATNATFYVMVWEEWASCDVSLLLLATSSNAIHH